MFFRAENLGPLKEAEVDLSKDMIVLAGPNNSGKTYLAWSVYGLHRFSFRKPLQSPGDMMDIEAVLRLHEDKIFKQVAASYTSKLHLCFAAERTRFAGAQVLLRGHDRPDETVPRDFDFKEAIVVEAKVLSWDFDFLFSRLIPACTLFPAERIAVNIFAKELALKRIELVDEMVDAEIEDHSGISKDFIRRRAGRYPWPIRDSLRVANDLSNLSKEKSPFAYLADEFERALLGGKVSVSDNGEMLFSPEGLGEPHLQMHLTASVVKSLSSLIFYFRHLAQKGDFIIIDEPELNLHPDNQRKITRLLAKAVRLGFKVMISTHSDYVLRELNHLIMLSKLPEGEAGELGYDPMCALNPARLGVYLFHENHSQPVPVEETGFSIKTIDEVVNQLNADEQRLYARLFG